jgi:hypothetical protein
MTQTGLLPSIALISKKKSGTDLPWSYNLHLISFRKYPRQLSMYSGYLRLSRLKSTKSGQASTFFYLVCFDLFLVSLFPPIPSVFAAYAGRLQWTEALRKLACIIIMRGKQNSNDQTLTLKSPARLPHPVST